MNQEILNKIESEHYRKEPLEFNVGDSVKVHTKVRGREGAYSGFRRTRHQRRGHGVNETFTVRRTLGEGVERVFPVHSPRIEKVVVDRQGKVRRAKLTYLRQRIGKKALAVKAKDTRGQRK